jgi:hypothetical protein
VKYIKYMKLHPYKKYPEIIAKPARAREGFSMEIGIHVLHVLHVPQADADAPESDQSRQRRRSCLSCLRCYPPRHRSRWTTIMREIILS